MPAQPVILNNTPLVALYTLDLLWLLRDLYGTVIIPDAVEAEFLAVDTAPRQQALHDSDWIESRQLAEPRLALSYVGLDLGEASVLALAIEQNAKLVIIDERKGRRYAQRLGLPHTGTIGIFLLAKERGLISTILPQIEQLLVAGLFLAPSLIEQALKLAGESRE